MNWRIYLIPVVLLVLVCCGGKKSADKKGDAEKIKTTLPIEETEVQTITLRTMDFQHELVSNGRLSARQTAELQFESTTESNVAVRIFVKNDDRVAAGAAIAMLDTFKLSNSFKTAENNLQKAHLELQDVLIGQGYSLKDKDKIPATVMQLANVRSGYSAARIQYDLARHNLQHAVLRTPIAGTVADLFTKTYSMIDATKPFCKIISAGGLEVDFTILENELSLIKLGDNVQIQSYASPDIRSTGSIVNINPSVDMDGTVHVLANVQPQPKLFNGMNVRISVFRSLGRQWVIPKSAVVLRTGKQVVFVYRSNSTARWNYVTTGLENSTQFTVKSETLREGDEIIVSGNEHLADGSKVKKIN